MISFDAIRQSLSRSSKR